MASLVCSQKMIRKIKKSSISKVAPAQEVPKDARPTDPAGVSVSPQENPSPILNESRLVWSLKSPR